MQVNFYATYRVIAGQRSLQLELADGVSVRQVIDAVVQRCPDLRPHWLDAAGELHAHLIVFLNGEDITTLPGGLDTPTHAADSVDFVPPVAGG